MSTNQIIWHQLPDESSVARADRLNKELLRIFFEGRKICPESSIEDCFDRDAVCHICGRNLAHCTLLYHGTPRFLESLDAMQLIVESGKFAEVREEYYHWLVRDGVRQPYECRILLYPKPGYIWFEGRGYSRQEAFYVAALKAIDYTVIQEAQGAKQ